MSNQANKATGVVRGLLKYFAFFAYCLSFISYAATVEEPATVKNLKQFMIALDQAYYNLDKKYLNQLTSLTPLEDELTADNLVLNAEITQFAEPWQYFTSALVHLRLGAVALMEEKESLADLHLDRALAILELDNRDQKQAELSAMRASLLGMKISIGFMRGMSLGGKADDAISKAQALNSHNALVQMYRGISLYSKPSMFGGDKSAAALALQQALSLYDDNVAPYWGYHDMLLWSSKAFLVTGKVDLALATIDQLNEKFPQSPIVNFTHKRIQKELKE